VHFYILLKKREKLQHLCNGTTDLHTVNRMTWNVSLKRMAVKKNSTRNSKTADNRHLENKSKNCNISSLAPERPKGIQLQWLQCVVEKVSAFIFHHRARIQKYC